MNVVVEGEAGAPVVVLVHGVGLDHRMWNGIAGRLCGHRQVVRYDLAGHGTAEAIDDRWSLGLFVDQLDDVATQAGLDRFDLVGFSLGALIAQGYALAHPARLRTLVLMNSVFDRRSEDRQAIITRVDEVRTGRYADSIEPALERWFTPEFSVESPHVVADIRSRLQRNDVESYASAYDVFARADEALAGRAGDIAVPTLVVTGQDDARSTPEMSRRLTHAMPNARCEIVPGLRHLAPVEAPAIIAALIDDFLKEPHV